MPGVALRVDLRDCAAIGRGARQALRGAAAINPTRQAIVRLGAEAAALLAAIPDTAELRARDRAFLALHPLAANRPPSPLVRRLRRLIAHYRAECGIDRLDLELAIGEIANRADSRNYRQAQSCADGNAT